jgi:phosphoribosylaminoimidazole-succinocarboxamide synthase
MTDEVVAGITDRYIELYEHITGEKFQSAPGDVARIESSILQFLDNQ